MPAMTTPTVTERPQALQPVTPPTFVFTAMRLDAAHLVANSPRPARRIVD